MIPLAAVLALSGSLGFAGDYAPAFDQSAPGAALPGPSGPVPVVAGRPLIPGDLAAEGATWGIDAQIAKLAARPPAQGAFTFAVIGDAEPGRFPWERAFAPPVGTFARFLKRAQALPADFILQLGDSVSKGTAADYRAHFKLLDGAESAPYFPVIGNHDRSRPNGAANKDLYKATLGRLDFYFDYGGWRFVGLDTADRRLRDDQLQWLERVVPFSGRCVIFTHVPPKFLKGKIISERPKDVKAEALPDNEAYWRDVLTAYFGENSDGFERLLRERRVARVYMGHIHAFGVARVGPTVFVLSGGGGSPLYPLPPGEPQRKMSHFIEARVSGGTISETIHELNGKTYPLPLA